MNAISEIAVLLRNGKSVRQSAEMSGLPITRIETIANGTINPAKVGFADLGESDCADWLLRDGDILISHINSTKHLGKCAIYEGDPPTLVHGMNLLALRVDPEVAASRYVYWILSSTGFRRKLPRITKHSVNQSSFNIASFKKLQISLPPLDEQKRIAAILDAADALRAKRREALAQLDTLLQSTFLDMFGDPVTNPMGWVETPFGDITTDTKLGLVRSSKEFGWDFGIPYVRMDAVTGDGYFLPDKVQSTHADEAEVEVFALRPGDFLFNTRNSKELVGKVCVFPGPEGWLFNNNLMRVRFRADVEPWVIAMQFRFRRVQRELEKCKSGTTSVFAVYWKSLRTLPVLVPPLDLQHRFAVIVESIEQQKACQRTHLAELDTLFASLQSRAFRGNL